MGCRFLLSGLNIWKKSLHFALSKENMVGMCHTVAVVSELRYFFNTILGRNATIPVFWTLVKEHPPPRKIRTDFTWIYFMIREQERTEFILNEERAILTTNSHKQSLAVMGWEKTTSGFL